MFGEKEIKETLIAYSESGMKKHKASKKLFISDTGLEYRFQKIKKITGLNPRAFGDLVELLKRYEKV